MSEADTAAEAAPEAEVPPPPAPPPPVVRLVGCDLPGHVLAWFGELDVPSLLAADDPRLSGVDLPVEPFVPPPAAPAPRICTPREFRQRFTAAERGALTLAASKALEAGDPSLQVFLDDLSASQVVELDHPDLRAGMDAIVAAKLLTRKRADAILAA